MQKKKIYISLAVVFVLVSAAIVGVILALSKKKPVSDANFNITNMNNNVKPQGVAMASVTIPEANTDAAEELAISLYEMANYNLKNDAKVAYYIKTVSEVLGVPTGGHRFYLKNGTKYYNSDYFYIDEEADCNAIIKGIIKGAAKESTQYAYRSYFDAELNKGFEQKAKEIVAESDSVGDLKLGTNWDELYFHNELEMPAVMSQSDATFKYCDFILDKETIKTCSVEYNSKNGFYTIKLTLDCSLDKTLGDSLKYLIEGAGDQNARYTDITQTIEIWDNGRYKTHFSYNAWLAPKAYGVLKMQSANDYRTYFYYDDFSLDVKNYPYLEECHEIIAA